MAALSRSAFVGRRALITQALDAVVAGQSCMIVGQAGVGKSLLIERIAAIVRADRPVHELVATRAAAELPLGVFLPLTDRVASAFEIAAHLRLSLARSKPLVTIDDAHLLDAPSAGLLLELARAGVPVLATAREGSAAPDAIRSIERLPGARRLIVPPFTETELSHLLNSRLGATPDPSLVAVVLQRTGGVPPVRR
jgi:predicted ATPase